MCGAVLGNHDYHVAPDVEVDTALKDRDFRWHCEKNYRRKFKACPKDHTGEGQGTLCALLHTVPTAQKVVERSGQEKNFCRHFKA